VNKKTIRFLKNLSTGLVIVAMVFAFLIAGIRIFGVQVYGVLTGSMEPAYPTGSLIYVKRVDTSDLRVNDVITFSISPGVIATHRIVELVPDENNPSVIQYRTKGDANKDVDASLVSANNIIGKAMFAIPVMGYVANFIQHPPGIYIAILVCGLMIGFVFYTDSLESKQNAASKRGDKRGAKRGGTEQRPVRTQQTQQRTRGPQGEYPRQRGYAREDEYARRREYARGDEYPRRREYAREDEYPRRREYAREDAYPRRREYAREDAYPRQREYAREDAYPRRREYDRRGEYSHQGENARRSEYSQSRNGRTGRM